MAKDEQSLVSFLVGHQCTPLENSAPLLSNENYHSKKDGGMSILARPFASLFIKLTYQQDFFMDQMLETCDYLYLVLTKEVNNNLLYWCFSIRTVQPWFETLNSLKYLPNLEQDQVSWCEVDWRLSHFEHSLSIAMQHKIPVV